MVKKLLIFWETWSQLYPERKIRQAEKRIEEEDWEFEEERRFAPRNPGDHGGKRK